MLAVITRPMVIATDAGTAKQFVPEKDKATGEDVPQEMSESEFGRLRRAGAAQRFIEVNHAEAEAEPAGEAIVSVDAAAPASEPVAVPEAEAMAMGATLRPDDVAATASGSAAISSQPKRARKSKE